MTKRETLDAAALGAGCLGRSADDEPVFVLCARDPLAARIVREWAFRHETAHREASRAKVDEALKLADGMDRWRVRRQESGR